LDDIILAGVAETSKSAIGVEPACSQALTIANETRTQYRWGFDGMLAEAVQLHKIHS
jgi:hypothetical protein